MILAWWLVGCVADPGAPGGTLETERGLYEVALSPSPDPMVVGDVGLLVEVFREGEPEADCSLAVDVWMPAMNHGIADPPEVLEGEPGSFDVSWVCPMAGAWDVTLTIDGAAGEDSLVVTYDVD